MAKEKISEETLKSNIKDEYFNNTNCKIELGEDGIDFTVRYFGRRVLWAEAKRYQTDINVMLAQLIITAYKVQRYTLDVPKYFAVFDSEKMVFIPYSYVEHLYDEFKNTDFDWTIPASNKNSKEFKIISAIVKDAIGKKGVLLKQENIYEFNERVFYFSERKKELKEWIDNNILTDEATSPIKITDSNFYKVFNDWIKYVKKTIVIDWEAIRNDWGLLDSDFFLADLFSKDNKTIEEKLYILLKSSHYKIQKINKVAAKYGMLDEGFKVIFNDEQKAHKQFWEGFVRPPENEYWDLILQRRDLLVPNDVRERLGAFFTPPEWAELAQKYMADVWGDLDDYYIWDCAGGTGNLLYGLANRNKLFISDINIENIYITQGRVAKGELTLLQKNCFQFDFLNDDFDKLPQELQDIIKNEPQKLIIFINPPYVESAGMGVVQGKKGRLDIGKNKVFVFPCSSIIINCRVMPCCVCELTLIVLTIGTTFPSESGFLFLSSIAG